MKRILELQMQYSEKREEMNRAIHQLNSQGSVLNGTLQQVRDVVASIQGICEQFDGQEFIDEDESHQEEPSSSITDPNISKSVSHASEAYYDGSCSESVSSGIVVDEVTAASSSESIIMEGIVSQQTSPPFTISSNMPSNAFYTSGNDTSSVPEKSFEEPRTAVKTTVASSEISKTPLNREMETKRTREDTGYKSLFRDKYSEGTSMGNVCRRSEKFPGMKYGRRNSDGGDVAWLPVASLNAEDVPVGSKIKFKYEFGGQLKTFMGKVTYVERVVIGVEPSYGLVINSFWKMKNVLISSSTQSANLMG